MSGGSPTDSSAFSLSSNISIRTSTLSRVVHTIGKAGVSTATPLSLPRPTIRVITISDAPASTYSIGSA